MRIFSLGAAALSLSLVAGMLFFSGGRGHGQNAAEVGGNAPAMGVLSGRATFWPVAPVAGPGISRTARPVAGARIMIYGPGGVEVATVTTDPDGRYRVELPPGRYRLEMGPGGPGRHTKDLPAEITIAPGQETRRDIRVDTGIRGPSQR
jgi:hypothetical protein